MGLAFFRFLCLLCDLFFFLSLLVELCSGGVAGYIDIETYNFEGQNRGIGHADYTVQVVALAIRNDGCGDGSNVEPSESIQTYTR